MARDSKAVLERADVIFRAKVQDEWDQHRLGKGLTGKSSTPPNDWFKKDDHWWDEALEEARRG